MGKAKRMAGLRLQWAVLLLCMTMVQADGEDGFRSLTGARQLLQDVDALSNSTADNSANGTAAGPSVEEIKFKNCAFHPDTFEPDKTPRDVLVRCYTKMRWESIDLLIDNERLIRRFDYFN